MKIVIKLMMLVWVNLFYLSACNSFTQPSLHLTTSTVKAFNASFKVRVLSPEAIPQSILKVTSQSAQSFADKTSERRKIEFFQMHQNPVALQLGSGKDALYLLSYLGTAKTRSDLNVELRVLHTSLQEGLSLNYSGPVTWGGEQINSKPALTRDSSSVLTFELLMGLPGNGYINAYSDYLEQLAKHLQSRYQSRPFEFNNSPFVYAIKQGEQLKGFLFSNQQNRLILGERKYADVQSVVFIGENRTVDGAYNLIGFNPKTSSLNEPIYKVSDDTRFGTFFQFGEL